jgi:protein-disulfide isomerase
MQAFYDHNRDRLSGTFEGLKERIRARLRDDRERDEAERFAGRLRSAAEVRVLLQPVSPPLGEAGLARVFAIVQGQSITSGDVEASLCPLVYRAERRLYALRRARLDQRENDLLLAQEAEKRKVTVRELVQSEVHPKEVREADARVFFEANRTRLTGDFEMLAEQIVRYLRDREARDAEVEFAARLRAGASVQDFLTAPEPPIYRMAEDDQPSLGAASAPVTLLVFADMQCPVCARVLTTLIGMVKGSGEQLRLVVRDFPLERHADARKAAEAAEAAREQGRYWEYVALLLGHQTALGIPDLKQYASQVGLDRTRFDAALDAGRLAEQVDRDLLDGEKLLVGSIPAVFLNGRPVEDVSDAALKAAVQAARPAAR